MTENKENLLTESTAPENVNNIRALLADLLTKAGFDLPNEGYDLSNEISVEGNDIEFRLVITDYEDGSTLDN